jgi:CRISPR type III-A-associated protein Csm2
MPDYGRPHGREGGFRREDRRERDSRPPAQAPKTPDISLYDSNHIIPSDLFDTKAEVWARLFAGVPKSQLRQIFEEVKRYDIKDSPKPWEETLPLVKMIRSKTAYRMARQNTPQFNNVYEFIKKGLQEVKSRDDYHVFCLFFEAVYGFYYQFGGSEPR